MTVTLDHHLLTSIRRTSDLESQGDNTSQENRSRLSELAEICTGIFCGETFCIIFAFLAGAGMVKIGDLILNNPKL